MVGRGGCRSCLGESQLEPKGFRRKGAGSVWCGRRRGRTLADIGGTFMTRRFNPAPGWPAPPEGWLPPEGWQPDPAWPPAPEGWPLTVEDGEDSARSGTYSSSTAASTAYAPTVGTESSSPRPWYKKKRFLLPIGALVLFVAIGALSGDPDISEQASPTQSETDGSSAAGDEEAAAAAAEEEANAAAEAEEEARAAAEAEEEARVAAEAEEAAKAAEEAAAAAEAQAAAERLDPSTYAEVGQRDWALVVKDPDSHAGERYVIYGNISQFDSATGPDAFLATTDGIRQSEWYEFEHNTLVSAADASILADVVESDIVKMHVEVMSSFSYETQIGGNTTVPLVAVNIIEVIGSSL